MHFSSTQNININNTTLFYNGTEFNVSKPYPIGDFEYIENNGMYIEYGHNTVINNIISMYNNRGIVISWCNKTQVLNTIASH